MGGYKYQTIQVSQNSARTAGPSARGSGVGAGVELAQKAMIKLNEIGVEYRANKEITRLKPQIDKAIADLEKQRQQSLPHAGVVVVIGTQEWEHPDPTGARAKSFLAAHVAGAGTDPAAVVRRYRSRPRLVQGAAKGWRRQDKYVWVTRQF